MSGSVGASNAGTSVYPVTDSSELVDKPFGMAQL
jgi:hypothetical protein